MNIVKRIITFVVAFSSVAGFIAFIIERFNRKKTKHHPYGMYEKYFKRPVDVFLSTGALIVFSPIIFIIALLVHIKLGSPILFCQERPGRDEKIFKLYKFRTMTDQKDKNGKLLPDEIRLTKFGKLLRSTSMDELPELMNIIKGDMAVIGPRPLLPEYLPFYTEQERHRHDVRPGLTGWAQINGRNAIHNWEERFEYDLEYVNHISFLMDLKIILLTVKKVLDRSDIQIGKEIKAGRLDAARSNGLNSKI